MIVYKDIIKKLKENGYTTYDLKVKQLISQNSLHAIRHNKPISTATIDVICSLANCQPGDIMEYIDDCTSACKNNTQE